MQQAIRSFLTFLSVLCTGAPLLGQAPQAAAPVSLSTPSGGGITLKSGKISRLHREVPDTYGGRQVSVGSGGGILGKETTYALLDDGRLFGRKAGAAAYTYIGRQTAANTKKVFWSVEDRCAIKKTVYQQPGNLYRFVGWRKGREVHRVTWAPGAKDVPAGYEQVYKGFIGMLPRQ